MGMANPRTSVMVADVWMMGDVVKVSIGYNGNDDRVWVGFMDLGLNDSIG